MREQDEAAEAVAEAMERALMLAAQSVERELSRIVKAGEDDIERLSRRLAEILANGAIDSVMGLASGGPQGVGGDSGHGGSANQIAATIARPAAGVTGWSR